MNIADGDDPPNRPYGFEGEDEPITKTENMGDSAIILNPYSGKDLLTKEEAIDLINHISGALLIHERSK